MLCEGQWLCSIATVEKQASERLMENVHPAGFAAGRNPEE
jgi:hypothetical protein